MKWFLWILAAAFAWTLHTRDFAVEAPEALPAVSAVSSGGAAKPDSGLARLRDVTGGEAPQPVDPVVLCRVGEEAEYLRTSDCELRGGHADREPVWAQVD